MDDLPIYFWIVLWLTVFLTFVTVVGHGIWLLLALIFRAIFRIPKAKPATAANSECVYCEAVNKPEFRFCGVCGRPAAGPETAERLTDLAAARRQLNRWISVRAVDEELAARLNRLIDQDRERISSPIFRTEPARPVSTFLEEVPVEVPVVQSAPGLDYSKLPESAWREPEIPVQFPREVATNSATSERPTEREPEPEPIPPIAEPAPPSRPWSEVIAAFMEQSNIRWGEIIGGLLIVGCSTALVVSLWSEIAAIPVLKFLIFTSVTAALFGVGFYTEHKWKLPTTSRGILTIATLLVPLNFLAIAAVSSGVPSVGGAVLVSELIAPAVFACMVYFAGRILTPRWPHLLVGGVLLTSIGQLLVRHWAEPGLGQSASLLLSALPVLGCVAATVFTLRRAAESEVDQGDVSAIFFTLGASIFAAVLPLGLLLFKTGTPLLTLTNIAPGLALIGLPPLAVGIFLWRALSVEPSVHARTAATAIGIVGGVIALVAMLVGWPNPASVLPAAVINCICWSYLAWSLRWPRFYALASPCLSLAVAIGFTVLGHEVAWQQTPGQSLFQPLLSGVTGQALTVAMVLLLLGAEIVRRQGRRADAVNLLLPACVTGLVGGAMGLWFGFDVAGDPQILSVTLTVLAGAALWVAHRNGFKAPVWIAVGLFWLALRQLFGAVAFFRFPWQTATLVIASIAAVVSSVLYHLRSDDRSERADERRELFGDPLRWSSLTLSLAVIAMLLQSRRWETTAMIDGRLFWLAAIWAALLSVIRSRLLFTATQAAITAGIALAIKLALQGFEWYSYLPSAFLHPWSLQIQGAAIVLTGLVWLALRRLVPRTAIFLDSFEAVSDRREADPAASDPPAISPKSLEAVSDRRSAGTDPSEPVTTIDTFGSRLSFYLHRPELSLDQLLTVGVGVAFFVLAIYGALPGVVTELTWPGAPVAMKELAGFPHAAVFGAGAWLLGGLLLIAFAANAWVTRNRGFVVGALALSFAVAPLLAARWEGVAATASAWRWIAAAFLLVFSAGIWQRERILPLAERWGLPPDLLQGLLTPVRLIVLALGALPALVFTIRALNGIVDGQPVGGPSAGLFYLIGAAVSYAVPLALVVVVLLGHAVRERSGGYAAWGGLATAFAVLATHLVSAQANGLEIGRVIVVQAFQLVAISSSAVAFLWLAVSRSWESREVDTAPLTARWTSVLLWMSGTALAGYLIPIGFRLYVEPLRAGTATREAGSVRSWLALSLAVVAAWWWAKRDDRSFSPLALFVSALSLVTIIGFTSTRITGPTGFHNLHIGITCVAAMMFWARWKLSHRTDEVIRSAALSRLIRFLPPVTKNWSEGASLGMAVAITFSLLMSFNVLMSSLWWAILPLFACAFIVLGFHAVTGSRRSVYGAGALVLLAANCWFAYKVPYQAAYSPVVWIYRTSVFVEWLSINAIALASVGFLALLTELIRRRYGRGVADETTPSFATVASIAGVFSLVAVLAIGLYADVSGWPLTLRYRFAVIHVAVLLLLQILALWERSAWYAVPGIYLAVLGGIGVVLDHANLGEHGLVWVGIAVMAAYSLLTSVIWAARGRWIPKVEPLGIAVADRTGPSAVDWILGFNTALVAAVIAFAVQVVTIFDEFHLRFVCAVAVAVQVLTFRWLAGGRWEPAILRAGLATLATGSVLVSWSFMAPDGAGTWLNRAVAMMVVMVACVALNGIAHARIARTRRDWAGAGLWLMPKLVVAAGSSLLFVLLTEIAQQVQYGVVMTGGTALTLVAVTILAAAILCVYFALSPAHDPLELSERWRPGYVYAAEALLVLLFVHIRLTVPEIFTGLFTAYWPFVVIAIAFAGVAVSEFLRRRGLMVLAEPLHRTGAFLPLLPAIAFWIVSSKVDYSAVLFAVGMVYGTVSLLRRSFGFGLLAALACNGGLWFFLQHTGSFRIDQHPQVWFIPAALSVLVAGHLNRGRFSEEQMTGLRYACLSVIYVSSTFDIFLNGVAQSPWLPMVLAGLAIAGVLCGVAFRVRAFVVLGALFLLIAITTMIRYAQVSFGWTWLWYLAGIVAGGLILLTFALFEKKRRELAAIER